MSTEAPKRWPPTLIVAMCGCTDSSDGRMPLSAGGYVRGLFEEAPERREESFPRFNVRHMAAPVENLQARVRQRGGRGAARGERDGILASVHDQHGARHALQLRREIEIAQALPHRFLHAPRH